MGAACPGRIAGWRGTGREGPRQPVPRGLEASSIPAVEETLRLHQANERTMLAWLRTGMTILLARAIAE